ncbi:MAG: PEP-CTERM sorting domain-containing protein [Armatimonadetes bacterium]|nr:PEP-CTERM sorting domain-containing protein [Armatimonadota bacterium]
MNWLLKVGLFSVGMGMSIACSATTIQFLATDGDKLYRADSTGAVLGSVTMNAQIQSLTTLPSGFALAGATAGDIIACGRNPVSGRYGLYRLDNPFGAANLVQIGSLDQGVGSLTFANGQMYGVEDSINPLRVMRFNAATGNTLTNYNTGISSAGGGGLSFNAADGQFYVTDATNNRLYRWAPGGTATLVGAVGFGFSNNGIEFHEGVLYGAMRRDSPAGTMSLGYFNMSNGAFTTQATLTGIQGAGTGFLAVPEPGSLAALGLGLLVVTRRKRKY